MNVLLMLNDLLATKGSVKYTANREKTDTICRYSRHHEPPEICRVIKSTEVYEYSAPAVMAVEQVVIVKEIKYLKDQLVSFPDRAIISRKDIRNTSPATITSSIALSVSCNSSWSVQKSNAITTTVGISAQVGFDFVLTGSTTLNFSKVVNLTDARTEGGSETVVRATTDNIALGPRQSIRIEFLAYEMTREIPYEAKVVFDGPLTTNTSGFTVASQLLSNDERTFIVKGKIRVTGVSETFLSIEELKTESVEPLVIEDATITTESKTILHVTDNVKNYLAKKFKEQKNLVRNEKFVALFNTAETLKPLESGSTIDPPDGTRHSVLYTTQEFRMTPLCPFNDAGLPGTGIFDVEHRLYTEHANGVLIRSWEEKVERFTGCRNF